MEKMRLQQELLRNPENREYIEAQLEWLKESDKGVMTEFERVDVDELLGWTDKDRKREKGRGKKDRDEIKDGPDRGDELYNSLFSSGGDDKSKKKDEKESGESANEKETFDGKSRDDKDKEKERDDDDRDDR
jgi:hypothetical protein